MLTLTMQAPLPVVTAGSIPSCGLVLRHSPSPFTLHPPDCRGLGGFLLGGSPEVWGVLLGGAPEVWGVLLSLPKSIIILPVSRLVSVLWFSSPVL